jgi:ring-1,2-phenylacetyl-CoA epoxidase subunit PaaE|tara:strand:+ start:23360 stop:24427 length:1068 start_codon:yes stop_codon:yes gene_type:complete
MTPKFHTLKISEITRETEDCVSVAFSIPKELKSDYIYQAGQYLTLKHPIGEEDIRRSYSLCSAPFENEWRVAIKKVENGKFSTYANDLLKVGDELEVMTPMGKFTPHIDSKNEKSYALFAAGSGITPIISIAKTILNEELDSKVSLFYGNKNSNSIVFKEEIEALKNNYLDRLRITHILSRENLGNKLQKGRIDEEKTNALFKAFLQHENIDDVYICGPEDMIFAVKSAMEKNGIHSENIHFELFTTPGEAIVAEKPEVTVNDVESNVKVIIDGDEIDIVLHSGQSILEAAHEAGADLPFACKGGVCCTCKAKIIEGTARMTVNYGLEPDEIEAGYTLTCQAHPTSEKIIVSFDD